MRYERMTSEMRRSGKNDHDSTADREASRLTIEFRGATHVIDITYGENARDRVVPCIAALVESMFRQATVEHMEENPTVSPALIAFERREAVGNFTRTLVQLRRFEELDANGG